GAARRHAGQARYAIERTKVMIGGVVTHAKGGPVTTRGTSVERSAKVVERRFRAVRTERRAAEFALGQTDAVALHRLDIADKAGTAIEQIGGAEGKCQLGAGTAAMLGTALAYGGFDTVEFALHDVVDHATHGIRAVNR